MSGFAGAGEENRRRSCARMRQWPSVARSGSALEIVLLGQIKKPPPRERVRAVRQVASALRKAAIEFLHDATPQQTEARISVRRRGRVKWEIELLFPAIMFATCLSRSGSRN